MIVKRNIILIGSMGSGKSHFGRNLADLKGWQFVDTDRVLETRFGLPIADIYKKIGEKAFRRSELDVLKKVSLYHEAVISVGGNFPIEHRTLKTLKKFSYIIGIRAAQFRIVSRVNRRVGKRPTMDYTNVSAFVHAMIQSWKPAYKQCDYVLDTTNGRTYDFMKSIEQELKRCDIQFKERRQPNTDTNTSRVITRSSNISKSTDINRNYSISNNSRSITRNSNTSRNVNTTKNSNTSRNNTVNKKAKQPVQQGKCNYEKNSSSNQRRRRTRNERSYKGHHKKSTT